MECLVLFVFDKKVFPPFFFFFRGGVKSCIFFFARLIPTIDLDPLLGVSESPFFFSP